MMGQRAGEMADWMRRLGPRRGLKMFAAWSDRIAAGEVPPGAAAPAGRRAQRRAHPVGMGE